MMKQCTICLFFFSLDNVHFQNTAQLVAALTKAGVKYQVQVSEMYSKHST